jgi:hypothetical protein
MAVSIPICNLALSLVRAPMIVAIDEPTKEARDCALFYPHCLQVLCESYSWSFTTHTAQLALLGTNERSREWVNAYALPDGVSQAIRLLPTTASARLPYQYPYDVPLSPITWSDFIIEGGKLYANADGAVLEYSVDTLEEGDMTGAFKDALSKAIAARLAVSLLDSQDKATNLLKMAEAARQEAIADDMNRQPNHEDYDEVGFVRRGY